MRGLQKRGQQVVPLKFRRETPLKPIPVEALCDFEGDQVSPCPGVPGASGTFQVTKRPKEWKGWRQDLRCFQEPVFISVIGVTPCQPPHPPRHGPSCCPGLLSHQLSSASHPSRRLRERSHWPTLESCVQPEPTTVAASAVLSLARPESHVHPEQSGNEGKRPLGLELHGGVGPQREVQVGVGWQSLSSL